LAEGLVAELEEKNIQVINKLEAMNKILGTKKEPTLIGAALFSWRIFYLFNLVVFIYR